MILSLNLKIKIESNSYSKSMSSDEDERPTFTYKSTDQKIRAGGVLIYRKDKNDNIKFLMIKCNGRYEDFGGKTDKTDDYIETTVAREAFEESNGILKQEEIYEEIVFKEPAYFQKSKYVVYFIETKKNYKVEDFGTMEYYEKVPRTVEWVPIENFSDPEFIRNKLHYRLRFKNFFDKIEQIAGPIKCMFLD